MTRLSDNPAFWSFARWTVGMVCLTAVLWVNANDFDMTEGKSIGAMGAVYGLLEYRSRKRGDG